MKFQPDWLALATPSQRSTLVRLLETALRSQESFAHTMLVAPPFPSDETDAQARATTVIRYLAGNVGNQYPIAEAK